MCMSSAAPAPAPASPAASPLAPTEMPPSGMMYTKELDSSIKLLLIGTACSATLIPIAVMLFFFSTRAVRRQPVFILNVFIIIIGLAEGAINIFNQSRSMLGLPVPVALSISFACASILVPTIADTVLLLRVVTVFSPSQMTLYKTIAVYVPAALLKLSRMAVELVFVVKWGRAIAAHSRMGENSDLLAVGQIAWDTPYVKAGWVLQLADSSFSSVIFLVRIRTGTLRHRLRVLGATTDTDLSGTTRCTFGDRIITLFWISTANFVFPVIFNLVLLGLAFAETSFLTGIYVLLVANYVNIIGVVLATIWSTSTKYVYLAGGAGAGIGALGAHRHTVGSPPRFAVADAAEGDSPVGDDGFDHSDIEMTVLGQHDDGDDPSKVAGSSGSHIQTQTQ